jgi:hypothetical protein
VESLTDKERQMLKELQAKRAAEMADTPLGRKLAKASEPAHPAFALSSDGLDRGIWKQMRLTIGVIDAARVAQRIRDEAVAAERARIAAAMRTILEPDELVEANPEAFSMHALRHMREQVAYVLSTLGAPDA